MSINGPPGYFKPKILADLSKASPTASSIVSPKTSISKWFVTFTICVCPPLIVKQIKGKGGILLFSSSIKCDKICACIWFTSIKGICKPKAKDFAKEVPTNKDPIKPGPLVNAIADKSSLVIFACAIACCTTGTMFC